MRVHFLFIIVIISILVAKASDVKFYSINDLYGISMREMASVCKDDNGFIWASSKTGIIRVTEGDCRIYELPYQTSDVISVRLAFNHSHLIAYTNNGQIFRYNSIIDQFELVINMNKMLKNRHLGLSRLLINQQGGFWMSTSAGFYHYNGNKLILAWNNADEIYDIGCYDENHLFMSNAEGIWIIDTRSMAKEHIYVNDNNLALHVSKLHYDGSNDKLWIGTLSNGVFLYDLKSKALTQIQTEQIPKQPILAIESNSDSTIMIGIDGQGIWELSNKSYQVLNVFKENIDDPTSLHGDGVYDIFCDNDNQVWVCTYSDGLSFLDRTTSLVHSITHKIGNSNSLCNNNVNKVIEDSRGNLWFATNNGISCWTVSPNQWKTFYYNKYEQAKVFLSLCEDNDGRIWAGTYSSGVYVLDGKTGQEIAHYVQGTPGTSISSNYIFDIFKDQQGNLWFGAIGEVVCYISKEKRFRTYPYLPVSTIIELSSDEILLACSYGLCKLNKQSGDIQLIIEDYLVTDILMTEESIWACTNGEGLICLNRKDQTIEKYTTKSGLPSNYVNSILFADGYIWLGTESGLCRFNPKDKTVSTYSSILTLSKISYNQNSKFRLRNGQFIWGTNNGAVSFDPSSIQQIHPKGKIFFQDINISGRSVRDSSIYHLKTPVDDLQEITLKFNQNNLSLELLPLDMTDTGSKFSWKMDGLDNEWSQPSSQRILTYTNIPNGDFFLKIRLYDSSLSQVIAEREIKIHITPPFWKTWWFYLLIFSFAVGIICFSLRFYINRLKQRHTEEKVRFFTNTAHDIRTSLTLIKGPVEELKKESDLSELGRRYLQLIMEQSKRLSAVVTQLMDFQKVDVGKGQLALKMVDLVQLVAHRKLMFESYAGTNKIELVFTADQSSYMTAIDELKMEKIVDNLISNAIKYSRPDNQVDIVLKCNPEKWILEVTDRGIGISTKAQHKLFREFYRSENAVNSKIIGSGIGLLLVKHYIVMHGGDISFVSKENVGSTFKIVVPFKEVHDVKKLTDSANTSEILVPLPGKEEVLVPRQTSSQQHEMRILIVEDNPDLQSFMNSALCGEFQVLTADDGVQGWEIIQKQQPDLVVSDVMMPNMDGFELCKLMKSTYETSHIPVILLTSLSEKAQQLHGLGLGADDYLTKPFDINLLSQRIKSIVRNRKIIRERALKLIKETDNKPILANDMNDKFVKKALEVVRQNIANSEFGKDEFASAMNVSSSLLYKKIKSLTDQSPVDFIKSIRLNYALELLQAKQHSVTEVSEFCGFSSVGYFSTAFKKYYGKAPTELD